jgi:hypothetical protein
MSSIENYSLQVPQVGGYVDVLPRYEDTVRSTGRIGSVFDEGLIDDLENFTVKTESGEKLRVVVLRPESRMDAEAQRCYILLSWIRSNPLQPGFDPEAGPERRGGLLRFLAAVWAGIRERPLFILGLIVIAIGFVLIIAGQTKLGQAFIDLGMKVILTLGALMNSLFSTIPAALGNLADWVRPVYFMTMLGA